MEQYGKILLIAMPAFLVLVLLEKLYGWYRGNDTVSNIDMISSLTSGVTNVTKDVLGLSIVILSYGWMMDHIALVHIKATWLTYLVAFIAIDFTGYWVHRIDHKINFFWNSHIIHHSSEEFNLACALRQSVSVFFRIFSFFMLPAALLGVPAVVIATVLPLHLFAQFWYHTRHIDKMGFLEKIIVTPSHHRVHHALNKEYIDKNLGQILIVWDKLFGTFQEELPDVPPVYGITRPVRTWNPIKINFQHLWLLVTDAFRAKNWKDKFRIWFMPTGWRPDDVAEKYPVYKIDDVYNFQKYRTACSSLFLAWSWIQLIALLLFISYLFGNLARIGSPQMYYYGAFVFIYVYAFTEMLDRNKYAFAWEILKAVCGVALVYWNGDWFGASAYVSWSTYAIVAFFIISAFVSSLFTVRQIPREFPSLNSSGSNSSGQF